MTITVLVSSFAPFGSFHVNAHPETTIQELFSDIVLQDPLLSRIDGLRLRPVSQPAAPNDTTLSKLCENEETLVSFRLTPAVLGGKGGFGSQLRAAGGRMSSQRTGNNDSCRDLSGRRLGTVKEAKKLAAYVESEPERKKAALEAKKEKLEKLERQLGITPGGSKDVVPHVGMKRRLDDTDFLEESQNIVESVKSSVAQGLQKRKKAKMDPPPIPATASSSSVNVKVKPTKSNVTPAEVAVA